MTKPAKFGVWRTVSGGLTGSHAAWLKADGVLRLFDTRAEAEAEAKRRQEAMAHNTRAVRAVFTYEARPYDDDPLPSVV